MADDPTEHNDFLTKRQWNQLEQVVRASPLDRSLFKRTFSDGEWAGFADTELPTIFYRDSEYLFSIGQYVDPYKGLMPEYFIIGRKPGESVRFEAVGPLQWDRVLVRLAEWLTWLKAEIEAPDLWAELASNRQALAAPIPEDNSPFTPDEQRQLRAQLDRIEGAVLADLQLTADEGTAFRADMDYLKESAVRSGRRDWTLQVVGILGGWVLGSVLPPQKVSEIWTQYFVPLLHSVGDLTQHLPRLGP